MISVLKNKLNKKKFKSFYQNYLFVITAFFFFIFCTIFFFQYLSVNRYPGDNGDTRHIILVLENFFLASTIKEFSFLEIFFFYPVKGSIFFSEPLWGVAWIYALLRLLSIEIFASYKILFFIVFMSNFLTCYYCSKKMKISSFISLIISSFFTFSLPIIAQDAHFALMIRFFVPLTIVNLYFFLETEKIKYLTLCSVFLFFQFLSGIYIAMFLLTVLLVFIIFYLIINKKYLLLKLNSFKKNFLHFVVISILAISLLIYLSNFLEISKLHSTKRGYAFEGLINLYSFFNTDRSIFWPNKLQPEYYPLHENQLYMGISFFIFLSIIFLKKKILFTQKYNDCKIFLILSLLSILLFFSFYKFSFYYFFRWLPGFSSMRFEVRSFLVIMFPLLIFVGMSLDKIIKKYPNYKIFFQILFIFFLIETLTAKKTTSNIIDENQRIEKYDQIVKNFNKNSILVFQNSKKNYNYWITELDFMFVSATHKLKTMNGFSSYMPKQFDYFDNCESVYKFLLDTKKQLLIKNTHLRINEILNNSIFIGFEKDCKVSFKVYGH